MSDSDAITIALRERQQAAIRVLDGPHHPDEERDLSFGVLIAPTGSGKTCILQAIAARRAYVTPGHRVFYAIPQNISREDVLAPMTFVDPITGRRLTYTATNLTGVPDRAAVAQHNCVYVLTHAALGVMMALPWWPEIEAYGGATVILDEWHHAGQEDDTSAEANATVVFKALRAFHERAPKNNRVLGATATPWRTDKADWIPENAVRFQITAQELQIDGLFPRKIRCITDLMNAPEGVLTREVVQTILRTALEPRATLDGRTEIPPTFLAVPARGKAALVQGEWFREEAYAMGLAESEVLYIIGPEGENAGEVLRAAKRAVAADGWGASPIKLVIACRRYESLDWPMCSRVVQIDVSGSLVMVLQLAGRGTRSKEWIRNYPFDPDVTDLIFLLPRDASRNDVTEHAQRIATIASAYDYSSAFEWYLTLWPRLTAGLRLPPGFNPGGPRTILPPDAADVRAGFRWWTTIRLLRERHGALTLGGAVSLIDGGDPAERARILRVLVAALAASSEKVAESLQAAVEAAVAEVKRTLEGLGYDPDQKRPEGTPRNPKPTPGPVEVYDTLTDRLQRVFIEQAELWADEVVQYPSAYNEVHRLSSRVDLKKWGEITDQIRALVLDLRVPRILDICDQYANDYTLWPTRGVGVQDLSTYVGLRGLTVAMLETRLGEYGLSLGKLRKLRMEPVAPDARGRPQIHAIRRSDPLTSWMEYILDDLAAREASKAGGLPRVRRSRTTGRQSLMLTLPSGERLSLNELHLCLRTGARGFGDRDTLWSWMRTHPKWTHHTQVPVWAQDPW